MADRKCSKVWLHFSKCDADYARCNTCQAKCKTSGRNTSNLKQNLVKHKIFLKAEECTIFDSLRSMATTPALGTVSPPASVCDAGVVYSQQHGQRNKTTEMLQYKQLDVVFIYSLKFIY
ncbi:hypothetical protein ILYODFUR_006035 [Ilyodon furcidens]|uniref:BED-type domain-containing protein n=1 Tax=Ilyodon furcidens TaxID=33524 RepID=A0ABV0SIT4_9TELE